MGDSKKRPLIFDLVNNFENGNAGSLNEDVPYQLCAEMADGDGEIDFELYDYIVDLRQALEDVKNTFEMSWDYNYESVKSFQEEYGRFPYNRELYHGVDLGSWCIVQRRQHQIGALQNERVKLLDAIAFPWNPREDSWMIRYNELILYIEKIGHVPKSTEHISLYNWLAKQKKLYKSGNLEKDREALLMKLFSESQEEFGMSAVEQAWKKRMDALQEFLQQNQRLPRAEDGIHDVPIGMWLVEQRSLERSGRLSSERRNELEAMGVIFQERKDKAFWENLELLETFIKQEKRFPDTTDKYEGFGLGVWCSRIREDYKAGILNIEQIEALKLVL